MKCSFIQQSIFSIIILVNFTVTEPKSDIFGYFFCPTNRSLIFIKTDKSSLHLSSWNKSLTFLFDELFKMIQYKLASNFLSIDLPFQDWLWLNCKSIVAESLLADKYETCEGSHFELQWSQHIEGKQASECDILKYFSA